VAQNLVMSLVRQNPAIDEGLEDESNAGDVTTSTPKKFHQIRCARSGFFGLPGQMALLASGQLVGKDDD
jgi:hypothetical protein